jgi:Rps23 Pro-64 3,4-dihydroxylase Tpa1-like proline 4-hydroxylase
VRDDEWVPTEDDLHSTADGNQSVSHSFLSSTVFPHSAAIRASLQRLIPGSRLLLSAGCYSAAGEHRIERHDDAAFRRMGGEGGAMHARSVAVALYLSREWRSEFGGAFVDLEEGEAKRVLPEFNSLVAFRVPRWHAVEPIEEGAPRRLSLFGWFYNRE